MERLILGKKKPLKTNIFKELKKWCKRLKCQQMKCPQNKPIAFKYVHMSEINFIFTHFFKNIVLL